MPQLDWQQILSQAISFLVLLAILRRFAWKPLLTMLDARRHQIERDLQQAAQGKVELARLQEEYAQRLAKIEDEARSKIQQAILEGKKVAVEIQEQARQLAYASLEKSKQTIELELAKAKVTLRDQMAEMTVDAVERVLRQKLDAKADRQLIDSVLDDLEREGARG
ncbi:MAG: ATP synthase F0 subunit B [Candidatus Omnitrophica bacterium CG11_big_fil_rev_8_21_14_0_20_63_9]|nr:MAG: ATP synthase F0 subunit B [Candidatus Omnitrophica bacterium CG11_big_fil_rev_8_21_14_0_20_63_9]